MIRTLTTAAILAMTGQAGLAACADHEGMCETASGGYHIELPNAENPPLLVFLHGYGGSAKGVLKNRNMVEPLLARGYAVMAPEGSDRNGRKSWNFFPGWEGRDEAAFLTEVVQDASDRFGVDADRVVLGGFSAGAFMVYYLACASPDTFSAYVPVSGGFWRPQPQSCEGPVRMFHTHGWTDNVVPLEGRILGGGRFHQGDIFAGLEIWRVANECVDTKPSGFSVTGQFMRRYWSGCSDGSMLELALFPGGHTVPKGWADMMVDWYEGLPGG
ncbi:alpha/beta hydrolase family esterase [Ruegeria profundi]|uniref:Polyhydroxybutyrate depolymerase n=1 Tax=Ruegeria profundi TaxID=1685378 RepID=A0A0X3U383_9RHOB|nr:PHB depolymerase family esterase [Ruegeria profundi]KUJ82254.1 polyhydroxybutyrate depolymerase [Ruegeria profundi]